MLYRSKLIDERKPPLLTQEMLDKAEKEYYDKMEGRALVSNIVVRGKNGYTFMYNNVNETLTITVGSIKGSYHIQMPDELVIKNFNKKIDAKF